MSITTKIYGLCSQVTAGGPMNYELRFEPTPTPKYYKVIGAPIITDGLITELHLSIKDAALPDYQSCTKPVNLGAYLKRPNNAVFNGDPSSQCYAMPFGVPQILKLITTNRETHEQDDPYEDSDKD